MIATVALAAVIVALLIERHLADRRHDAEVQTLLAAALSRSAGEFGGAVAKIKADPDPARRDPEMLPPVVGL